MTNISSKIKIVLLSFLFFSCLQADIIYKKDNSQIEANLISEDDEGVVVEINGKQQRISWNEIKSIKKIEKEPQPSDLKIPSGLKVPKWQSSVVLGLQGFSMISKEMVSNTMLFSFGYQPSRKFEVGVNYEVDFTNSKVSDLESSMVTNSYTLFFRFYPKPNKKDFIAWLEGKTKMNPMKFRYFLGFQVGKAYTKHTMSDQELTNENTTYKIELVGLNWSINPNVSLNLNLLTIDPSRFNPEETDSELVATSSIGLRFLIPVGSKKQ